MMTWRASPVGRFLRTTEDCPRTVIKCFRTRTGYAVPALIARRYARERQRGREREKESEVDNVRAKERERWSERTGYGIHDLSYNNKRSLTYCSCSHFISLALFPSLSPLPALSRILSRYEDRDSKPCAGSMTSVKRSFYLQSS